MVYFHGYLILSPNSFFGISTGTLHLFQQALEGFPELHPYTVSRAAYGHDDSEEGVPEEFGTDWMPQIVFPTTELFAAEASIRRVTFPQFTLTDRDQGPEYFAFIEGLSAFEAMPDEYYFVEDFIKTLTNEYLIW